jgi:fructose-bisphosphate aldolase class II
MSKDSMKKYQKFGLVNTKTLFKKAMVGGYAVPAFNFNNMEQLQAIMLACLETQSPVILQVSKGAREYADESLLMSMAEGGIVMMKRLAKEKKLKQIPVVLHLDHGGDFAICKSAIDSGFSSVMIDGSALSYKENVAVTKKVVAYAHARGVSVEGELGVLGGVEDEVSAEKSHYTQPEQVEDFVKKTGVDSLAISIGTSHGAFKFKPGQNPKIRLDILKEISWRLPSFPIVLHGASSIPDEYVTMINKYGGDLISARGIPEAQLKAAAKLTVCKINIDSDGRLVMTGVIRKYLAENKKDFDPRKYLTPAREALKKMYSRKIKEVLMSNNCV